MVIDLGPAHAQSQISLLNPMNDIADLQAAILSGIDASSKFQHAFALCARRQPYSGRRHARKNGAAECLQQAWTRVRRK